MADAIRRGTLFQSTLLHEERPIEAYDLSYDDLFQSTLLHEERRKP